MTEKQKRLAIIGGTVLAAVLLLLTLSRKGAGAGAVGAAGNFTLPTVFGPSLGPIYTDGGTTLVIPGLDLSGPNLNMVGACCSDCMQSRPASTQGPTYATVNNYTYNETGIAAASQDFGTKSHYTDLWGNQWAGFAGPGINGTYYG